MASVASRVAKRRGAQLADDRDLMQQLAKLIELQTARKRPTQYTDAELKAALNCKAEKEVWKRIKGVKIPAWQQHWGSSVFNRNDRDDDADKDQRDQLGYRTVDGKREKQNLPLIQCFDRYESIIHENRVTDEFERMLDASKIDYFIRLFIPFGSSLHNSARALIKEGISFNTFKGRLLDFDGHARHGHGGYHEIKDGLLQGDTVRQ